MLHGSMADEARSLFAQAARWIGTHVAATTVAIAGALFYGVLRVSYANFYGRFDVEPEEVGLGQTEILTQTGVLLFVTVLLVGSFMAVEYVLLRALGALPSDKAPAGAPLWRRALAFTRTPYWIILIPTILILVFLVAFSLPGRARGLADRVERGEAVRPRVSLVHWDLAVRALPASLRSLGGNTLPRYLRSRSLRYLGKGGGVLVLYDWKTKRTLRVPMGSVAVMTSD
jgi:hypothetical protein